MVGGVIVVNATYSSDRSKSIWTHRSRVEYWVPRVGQWGKWEDVGQKFLSKGFMLVKVSVIQDK